MLHLQVEPTGKPGYVKLLLAQNNDDQQTCELIRMAVDKNSFLSADRLANRFMGELKRTLQQCQQEACSGDDYELTDDEDDSKWKTKQLRHINDRIKLRRHGPAIQMDVMQLPDTGDDSQGRSSSTDNDAVASDVSAVETACFSEETPATPVEEEPSKLFYSVDMVPTIQIPGRDGEDDYYVAKPIKGASKLQIAWRRSFSVKEKDRLTTMDEDNGCRKQVLRVLKVIRNREAGLALLTSYHLKTVLFRKTDELSDPTQWKVDCLGQRLMDVIGQMEMELGKGVMPHYFLPDVNLLDGMKEKAVINMRLRLKHLKNSERKTMKLLKVKD